MAKVRRLMKIVGLCFLGLMLLTPQFATAKTYKLTISDHNPPFTPPGKAVLLWAKTLNEKSGGRLDITVHSGGALLSGVEAYRGVQSGICDGAHYVVDSREGFHLNLIMGLPFMGWPERTKALALYRQLLKENKAMRDEWQGVTIIGTIMMPPTGIHTVKKQVRVPADLKGMKIMGAEFMLNAAMQAGGATPVQLDIGDMAPSLNTGLIDGIMNHIAVLFIFRALEQTKYHTYFGEGGINITPMSLVMNTRSLNRLPNDLKEMVLNSGPIWENEFLKLDEQTLGVAASKIKGWGHNVVTLSPSEIKVWYDLVKHKVHDGWLEDARKQGKPGQQVYDRALSLVKQYQ